MLDENIGAIDRAIRAVLGIALLAMFLWGMIDASYAYIVALIGALLLMTAVTQRCLLYSLLKFNTVGKRAAKAAAKPARRAKRRRKR